MSSLDKKFKALADALQSLTDPQDRLQYFVELASSCAIDSAEKLDCFLVPGCISRLWIVPVFSEGRCYFRCDGDAVIPKGVASALLTVFSGETAEELLDFDPARMHELGLGELLGFNRRSAVTRLLAAVQRFAQVVTTPVATPVDHSLLGRLSANTQNQANSTHH